jgi:N4-(beta-N-acetylglucosaminyl)-L-asparaginase
MSDSLDRRDFLRHSFAVGAGAAALGRLPALDELRPGTPADIPIVVTSHTNQTGHNAMVSAWEILSAGGVAMDAVEKGANTVEVDPEDTSVGYGGLPNADGVVQLDASCMDGRSYNAGSVGALENIKTPSSVARVIMERTDHIMLVGKGALEFAKAYGFKEENLLTPKAREMWLRWRENLSPTDDYGPPAYLRGHPELTGGSKGGPVASHHGTVNVLAIDRRGDIAGITTTSGLSWKIPGRVGDSPILGAGLYVDNMVGAAGATGLGEDTMKSCACFYIVMRMRAGRSPQEACEDAQDMIVERYKAVGFDYVPSEKFVAINKDGAYGCSAMASSVPARMTVRTSAGLSVHQGSLRYSG